MKQLPEGIFNIYILDPIETEKLLGKIRQVIGKRAAREVVRG